MRILIIVLLAIIISIGGTYLLQRPEVNGLVTGWAEGVSAVFGSAAHETETTVPQMSRGARRSNHDEETGGAADTAFWFNQGLSLFYTLLGVIMSEAVRFVGARRK